MNIRVIGLSILMSILFAIPAAMATAVSSVTGTPLQPIDTSLILADAHQHEQQGQQCGEKDKGMECCMGCMNGMDGAGHAGHSGHGNHKKGGGKKGHGHHGSYAHNVAMQAEALGLSDEQLGKIARLHLKEYPQAHEHLKHKMMETMKAFRQATAQPGTDIETLQKLGQAHVDSFNEMVAHHVEERKAVISILTPEQIEKLKDIKEDSESKHNH